MSVVLVGDAPAGPILVSDAFVLHTDPQNVKSFKDASLQTKIIRLDAFEGHSSLVGDQTIEYAVMAIDNWAYYQNKKVNFLCEEMITKGVIPTAEKLVELFKLRADSEAQPETDGADLYIVTPGSAWEFQIKRTGNKYSLKSLSQLPKNEVLINYAGHKTKTFLHGNVDNYFERAFSIIEEHHIRQKNSGEHPLPYDLDSRFCGVFYPNGSPSDRKIISPFKNYTEFLTHSTGHQKVWDYISESIAFPSELFN